MQEGSEDVPCLREAVANLRAEAPSTDVRAVIRNASTGNNISESDLKLFTSAVMTRLAYKSWQWLGAVTNALLEEFTAAEKVTNEQMEDMVMPREKEVEIQVRGKRGGAGATVLLLSSSYPSLIPVHSFIPQPRNETIA